jgi:hypothetical protein
MTKSSTLENVLYKHQTSQNNTGIHRIPRHESINMIIRYSMALMVVKTAHSGTHFLIMN